MAFFVGLMWAMLSFGNPGFGHGAAFHTAPLAAHHAHGGTHVMDSGIGGPVG